MYIAHLIGVTKDLTFWKCITVFGLSSYNIFFGLSAVMIWGCSVYKCTNGTVSYECVRQLMYMHGNVLYK
jgi:hypothetical protein